MDITTDYRTKLPEIGEANVKSSPFPEIVDHVDVPVISSFDPLSEILGQLEASEFPRNIPRLRKILAGHVEAACDGDPTVQSIDG